MPLEALVIEWRDAREAILLVNWGDPVVAKAHTHLWKRFGNAEATLMAHARKLPTEPEIAHYSRPDGGFMMIDMGANSDVAIRTGDSIEFDVAAGTVQIRRRETKP
jgi:hypothetical protein